MKNDKLSQGYCRFEVFCTSNSDFKMPFPVEQLSGSGISVLPHQKNIDLKGPFFCFGKDEPEVAVASVLKRLTSAAAVHVVEAKMGFSRDAANMDYFQGALFTALSIAEQLDGLVLDRTSGIVETREKLQVWGEAFDSRDAVVIGAKAAGNGATRLETFGLSKFGQKDFVVESIHNDVAEGMKGFLYNNVFPKVIGGETIFEGETLSVRAPEFHLVFASAADKLQILDYDPASKKALASLARFENTVRSSVA